MLAKLRIIQQYMFGSFRWLNNICVRKFSCISASPHLWVVTGSLSLQNNTQCETTKQNKTTKQSHKTSYQRSPHKKGWLWHPLFSIVLGYCWPKVSMPNKVDEIWLLNMCIDFWTERKTKTCKFTKLPYKPFTYNFSETGSCKLYSQHLFIST